MSDEAQVSPGRAAYEAYTAAYPYEGAPWEDLSDEAAKAMEAAAQAVLNQAFPGLRRKRDELQAERDDYRDRLRATDRAYTDAMRERDEARAERDKAVKLTEALERLLTSWTRGMYSAHIDCVRGDVKAAIETLAEGLDGYDGTEWDGKETGAQWWERTKDEEAAAS